MEPDILILRQVWDFLTICWMDLPVMGSLISVSEVHGDLQVDDHHTIEDTGIVLGTALKEAIAEIY